MKTQNLCFFIIKIFAKLALTGKIMMSIRILHRITILVALLSTVTTVVRHGTPKKSFLLRQNKHTLAHKHKGDTKTETHKNTLRCLRRRHRCRSNWSCSRHSKILYYAVDFRGRRSVRPPHCLETGSLGGTPRRRHPMSVAKRHNICWRGSIERRAGCRPRNSGAFWGKKS